MKTKLSIFSMIALFFISTAYSKESGFVRQSKFPMSWIKQQTSENWSLIQGQTGPYKVSVSLVDVKEEPPMRKLASTEDAPVTYKVEAIKKDITSVNEDQLKKHQVMMTITAP